MRKRETKLGIVVFALAVVGYLSGSCLGEITEYGHAGTAEPVLLQSFTSEAAVAVSAEGVVVLTFEDLPFVDGRLPSGYAGLEWDCYEERDPIYWLWRPESVDPTYSEPHSGKNYLVNAYGVNHLGFSLPNPDDRFVGAWFAKTTVTTPNAVRFDGYNASHVLVQQSTWLTLSSTPQYLAANFDPVARIEVEHSSSGSAWYTMDDLTYQTKPACTPPPAPANPDPCDGAKDVAVDTNLAWGEACSADCQLPNGGFETGGFAPWTTVTGPGEELTPWIVTTDGSSGYFGNGVPFEGTHFAQNGFDGDAGLFYDIYQEIAIPACATSAILKWSERIQWNMVPYGATQPRIYVVSLQPAGGGAPLAVLYTMNLNPRTSGDTGYVSHSVDLLSAAPGIAGQTVRINFHEYIPETYTGPAQFDLDGISLICNSKALQGRVQTTDTHELKEEYARIRGDTPAASDTYDFDNNTGDIQIPTVISYTAGVLSTPGQIVNGDFETGNFSGWTLANSGNGTFVINNGTYNPPSPDGPLPPYSGNFSAMSDQSGPGVQTIYQDVTLPAGATSAILRWADMIHNHAGEFLDPEQEFRVEIRDTSNNVLSTLFSTNPGDPLFSGWTERSAGISQFAGRTIRIAFTAQEELFFFNVHLDNIRIESGGGPSCPTVYDVYFGTDPNALELISEDVNEPLCDPTPNQNEILDAATTYYWQVVAKNCCGQTEGNIWSFTTAGHPPDCSGAVASVSKIWPPNHKWVDIEILGVVDPDGDPVTITITGITQDELVIGQGSGNTVPDGGGIDTSVARVRAERSGLGNGRVYKISFDADDGKGGVCSGSVNVCVPHDAGKGHECADDGQLYDSTATYLINADLNGDGIVNELDFAIFASYWLQTYELDK
jgi:hypothetical protein